MSSVFRRGLLMGAALLGALIVGDSVVAGPSPNSSKRKAPEAVPGQFVVELKSARSLLNKSALEASLGGRIVRQVRPDMVTIERKDRGSRDLVVRDLIANPEVKTAEPNWIFRANTSPNDPDYSKLWGMNNSGLSDSEGSKGLSGVDISVERAWEVQRGSKDVIVAIIDTGVDYTHPDLKKNMWVNEAEANGKTGVDDDNNGFIDDIHGYNFVAKTGDPMDDNGHGSHVAGTIGAEPDNAVGVAGVNWNVSIMALKFLDAGGGGSLDAAVAALDYARKSGAKILSNSWGGNLVSPILEKAVGETREAGQLFVVAAGNDSDDNDTGRTIPATYKFDNILSVAALDNRGEVASFSNYGAQTVQVGAPGVNILSTGMRGGYETLSGTSMACPHVSGIAALVYAQNPSWTYLEVKDRIEKSARPLRGLNGKVVTGGLADAYYAVTGEEPPLDPNDPAIWAEQKDYAVSSVHPYTEKYSQTYTVTVPGAKRMALHFSKFETEAGYDKVAFQNASGETFGTWSGTQSGRYGPIVEGDTIIMKFTSDSSQNGYGFDVDRVSVDR